MNQLYKFKKLFQIGQKYLNCSSVIFKIIITIIIAITALIKLIKNTICKLRTFRGKKKKKKTDEEDRIFHTTKLNQGNKGKSKTKNKNEIK